MSARYLLVLLTLSAPAIAQTLPPGVINAPPTAIGDDESIGSNTTLNVTEGGSVGRRFRAGLSDQLNNDVLVNISGGDVGDLFLAFSGSEVNISGGNVGGGFSANRGIVNIRGGTIDDGFQAYFGSLVNISGGNVGVRFRALPGSEVNISGGTVGGRFIAARRSEVSLFGTDFLLDDVPLEALVVGNPFTITDRGVTLSGFLADGSAFSFPLDPGLRENSDHFHSSATLTVTLVPEPSSLAVLAVAPLMLAGRRTGFNPD